MLCRSAFFRYSLSIATPIMVQKKTTVILPELRWFLAEKEGFEPSIPFWGIHDFQSCALGQLRDFSIRSTRFILPC